MSEWTLSATCNATCDGGIGNATRTVISQPRFGGAACPTNLFRTDFACNTQPCFQNCSVSEWTEYSNCSAACGTGTKYRNRTVVLPAYGGGTPCPALNETASCLVTPCPVDCVLGEFELQTNCSALCGTGYEVYRAPIVTPAAFGGKDCYPFLFPLCNRQQCDNNIYQNCSFKCNGTDAFFNITTLQSNTSSLTDAGCNITCVTLDPVDCLVSGGAKDEYWEWKRACLRLKWVIEFTDDAYRNITQSFAVFPKYAWMRNDPTLRAVPRIKYVWDPRPLRWRCFRAWFDWFLFLWDQMVFCYWENPIRVVCWMTFCSLAPIVMNRLNA